MLLSGAAGLLVSPTAYAQQLEQIIVTAEKREENLQDTPISISAFTVDAIERTGAADISAVAQIAPNVVFDTTAPISGASNAAGITIRGVGQTDFALTTEAGVGTYVDGVYSSRSLGGVLDVVDIERMEILRGPQGTLFGRNTIGGAINIISTRPSDEFGGKLEVTGGNQGRIYLRGSVDIPLTDTLRTRFSASSKNQNGFVESGFNRADFRNDVNVPAAPNLPIIPGAFNEPVRALDDLGNENRQAFRGTIEWDATEQVRVTVHGDYGRVRENNAPNRLVGITGDEDAIVNGQFVPAPARGPAVFLYNAFEAPTAVVPPGFTNALYTDANFVRNDDVTFGTASPSGTELDSWGVSGTIDWDILDTFRIKSITAYRDTQGSFNRDADGSPFSITETFNFGYEHSQFSQELQFIGEAVDDRLQYIAGLYYFSEEGSDPIFVNLPDSFGDVFQPVADIDNKSYAAFAQATFDVTPDLSITAGVR
ncbi:MAG: TonB-dependent receptor, partial [Pseudomonadota bacterium]